MRELKKVLLLEDVPANAGVVQMALKAVCDIEVQHAMTGEEALEAFRHFNPDLCLFDLVLPGMSGLETMQQLPTGHDVPVVFLTAWADRELGEILLGAGAVDIVSKPFDALKLGARLEKAFRYHQRMSQLKTAS